MIDETRPMTRREMRALERQREAEALAAAQLAADREPTEEDEPTAETPAVQPTAEPSAVESTDDATEPAPAVEAAVDPEPVAAAQSELAPGDESPTDDAPSDEGDDDDDDATAPSFHATVFDNLEADLSPAGLGARPSDDETQVIERPTSRRDLRPEWKPVRRTVQLPRLALLGSLGTLTILAPLAGTLGAVTPASAGTVEAASAPISQVVAEAAASNLLDGSVPSGANLVENPAARVVAVDMASRAVARAEVDTCSTPSDASANGLVEAYVSRVSGPVRPMAEGTYRDTSRFGARWGSTHYGTDMAAPVGTPMYAIADGEVVHVGDGIEGRSGTLVIIHSVVNGVDTWFWYGHMYEDQVYVTQGQQIRAGELVGGVGNRGYSTGPHLHLEIHTGAWDNAVDPLVWLDEQGAPFPGQC